MPSPLPRVLSANVGRARPRRDPENAPTGIDKRPTDIISVAHPGPRRVVDGHGVSGVATDHVGDGRFHGGWDRAVYAYSREELDLWADVLGRELPNGHFGENLTTSDLDVDAAEVGDRWHVGSAVLEVRWTRQPCATFGEWMGEPGWVKRFMAHGRTGALLSVVEPGEIRAADPIEVVRSGSGIDLPTVLHAKLGGLDLARRVLDADVYTGHRRQQFLDVLQRDRRLVNSPASPIAGRSLGRCPSTSPTSCPSTSAARRCRGSPGAGPPASASSPSRSSA